MLDPTAPSGLAVRPPAPPPEPFGGERPDAIDVVAHLCFGCPGEALDTAVGRDLLLRLFARLGLHALTDEAIRQLAALHLQRQREDRTHG